LFFYKHYKYNKHLHNIRMDYITQHFRKRQLVWWRVGSSRPNWIPEKRIEQAAEIKDIDGDLIMITGLNEMRKEETYIVTAETICARGYNG
jgi:hypothetical protein